MRSGKRQGNPINADVRSDFTKAIFVSAGEASGDLYGAMFLRELRALDPSVSFFGMGGPLMRKEGLLGLADMNQVSVVGITEVIARLPGILRVRRLLKEALNEIRPRLMVLVDFPDFHMSLLAIKERIQAKVFYLIPPQVWAWREGRVRRLKRYVDLMGVILPFEEEYYKAKGINAKYLGHPLLELYPKASFEERDPYTVGVLPGSRTREVERNLPHIYGALIRLKEDIPNLKAIISIAPSIEPCFLKKFVKETEDWLSLSPGVGEIFKRASVCCVVSGTATLEAALVEMPMVVVYRLSKTSYMVGRMLSRVRFISLPNLILGKEVVHELVQEDVNSERIYQELLRLMVEIDRRQKMAEGLKAVRERLASNSPLSPAKEAALLATKLMESF